MHAEVAELDGLSLAEALRAGIYRLFTRSDHINKINVFPVPDGDTGTNLSMTLSAVLAAIEREPLPHAGALLVRIADAAIDGARGNSGAILAQFLLGLGDKAGHLARITIRDFAAAASTGAAYARDALSQPREGTLLTVLRDFSRQLEAEVATGNVRNFRELFAGAMTALRASLDHTRDELEELRSANVVDAGALGFVEMVEGMTSYLETGELGTVVAPVHSGDELMIAGAGLPASELRYCTECLVTSGEQEIDLRHLREGLSALGASLVVSGSKRKARIHIHTDDPERVFRLAAGFGAVAGQKADDMVRQQAAAHHQRQQRVAIVADSAADIPEELLERLDIHMVPLRVHFGSRSYLDKVSMSPAEFYRELASNPEHPKTSQPPPGDFRRMYEFLASHYEAVVSIALTSKASGTYNAAASAAQRVSAEGRPVTVLDSGNASLGQGLVAIVAAECAQRGGDAAAVIAAARAACERSHTYALLATVDHAVKGGRVPKIVKTLARWLHFSPVLGNLPGGKVGLAGVIWGQRNRRSHFARFVRRRMPGTGSGTRYRVLVGHANAPDEAHALLAEIRDGLPAAAIESTEITAIGPALGVHGGPGLLVAGVLPLDT